MSTFSKYRAGWLIVGGAVAGAVVCLAVIRLAGFVLIDQQDLDVQARLIDELREENYELTNDLFEYQGPDVVFDTAELPYRYETDASAAVAAARQKALEDEKFLMVTFGANWCLDCRTLYHHMQSPEVRAFTEDTLDFISVNVGKFNLNLDVAADVGVSLDRGIPVAVFFSPDGKLIGTTNDGQLEPARFYSSKQILKFVRDIVEKSLIAAPDSVQ